MPAAKPANDNSHAIVPPGLVEAAVTLASGRRASVTVQLDPARHLGLRIACAINGRSADAIMNDALDAYLRAIPGLPSLLAGLTIDGGCTAATTKKD